MDKCIEYVEIMTLGNALILVIYDLVLITGMMVDVVHLDQRGFFGWKYMPSIVKLQMIDSLLLHQREIQSNFGDLTHKKISHLVFFQTVQEDLYGMEERL